MSLRSWLKSLRAIQTILMPWETGASGKSRPTDYKSLVDRYQSWVYKCASTNAHAVASAPVHLYVRGSTSRFPTKALTMTTKQYLAAHRKAAEDVKEITAHPVLDLLGDMNPQQTGIEVLELTALYQELTGNAYWWLDSSGPLGIPTAVYPLMSQYVKIVPDSERFIRGFLYGRTSSQEIAFDAQEVIHFRYPNPADLFYGLGPLQAALKAADRFFSMAQYEQEFFDNSARMDFAIKLPEGTPTAERQRLLQEWKEKYQGKGKRHLPGFLLGDMSIETISYPPRDTTLVQLSKLSREEIAGIFGIPMTFLEISAARAEAEAHQYTYALYTLLPRLSRMEATLNERLIPRFDDSGRLFLAFENPVPENVELALKVQETHLKNFVTSVNEERAKEGIEPVDWGKVPILPSTGMPVGTPPAVPMPFRSASCPVCKTIHKQVQPVLSAQEQDFAATMEKLLGRQIDEVLGKLS